MSFTACYPHLWVDRVEGRARRIGGIFPLVVVLARRLGSFPLHLRLRIVIPMVTGVDTIAHTITNLTRCSNYRGYSGFSFSILLLRVPLRTHLMSLGSGFHSSCRQC